MHTIYLFGLLPLDYVPSCVRKWQLKRNLNTHHHLRSSRSLIVITFNTFTNQNPVHHKSQNKSQNANSQDVCSRTQHIVVIRHSVIGNVPPMGRIIAISITWSFLCACINMNHLARLSMHSSAEIKCSIHVFFVIKGKKTAIIAGLWKQMY